MLREQDSTLKRHPPHPTISEEYRPMGRMLSLMSETTDLRRHVPSRACLGSHHTGCHEDARRVPWR